VHGPVKDKDDEHDVYNQTDYILDIKVWLIFYLTEEQAVVLIITVKPKFYVSEGTI
jgi:hypothetical protein